MAKEYAIAPEDAHLRSILFLAFSAEESGLNGARHYADNPIADIKKHVLMMNFDMIGRITNKRLGVFGVASAKGMQQWLEPIFEESSLEIVASAGGGGGSDHLAFISMEVPSLFAICADFHQDYHTPRDTSDKINRVGATKAVYLFADMINAYASTTERFELADTSSQQTTGRASGIKVRCGIRPGSYSEDEPGIPIGGVTPGTAAASAESDRTPFSSGAARSPTARPSISQPPATA